MAGTADLGVDLGVTTGYYPKRGQWGTEVEADELRVRQRDDAAAQLPLVELAHLLRAGVDVALGQSRAVQTRARPF